MPRKGNQRTTNKETMTELTERLTEDRDLGLGSGKVRSMTEILSKTPRPEMIIGEINTPTNRPVLREMNANVTPVVLQQKAKTIPRSQGENMQATIRLENSISPNTGTQQGSISPIAKGSEVIEVKTNEKAPILAEQQTEKANTGKENKNWANLFEGNRMAAKGLKVRTFSKGYHI
ncbi:PREDICTED: uncharacterized protein LOC109233118 [Nicotiana attenuata]|uniref:uncharacterized protein LOC109233118 n=1 Tax=Nicotiana attenuata TaxID=49451 RepID=UPI000905ACC4|nr:PREDICTED: uncharacterized protein LOC109233118 [Nicotiana attenuata]